MFSNVCALSILAVSLLTSLIANAANFDELKVTPMTIKKAGVEIHGVRVGPPGREPNLDKPWVIFPHGLTSNYHEMESIIPHVVAAGYDCFAFNFRGHGNGAERSIVTNYREGDYKFENLADIDLPLMIEAIQELHPGAGRLIGHSMGGMVPRAAFHREKITANEISAMILIGSPAHFKTAAAKPDYFGMQWHLRNYLFYGSGKEPILNVERARSAMKMTNLLGPIAWAGNYLVASSMKAQMEKELGPLVHATPGENWSQRAMSNLTPKDIFRSFADFQVEYPYDSVSIPVPIMHIVGDKDTLAPANDIVRAADPQSREAGYYIVRVKEIGHFGIVAPWVIDGYIDDALAFLESPSRLGPKNRVISEFSPRELSGRSARCEALFH